MHQFKTKEEEEKIGQFKKSQAGLGKYLRNILSSVFGGRGILI